MPRPFSCGTQYGDWFDSNCGNCEKSADEPPCRCDIQEALDLGCFGDGEVSEGVAERMGFSRFGAGHYNWPCLEHQPPFDVDGWLARKATPCSSSSPA